MSKLDKIVEEFKLPDLPKRFQKNEVSELPDLPTQFGKNTEVSADSILRAHEKNRLKIQKSTLSIEDDDTPTTHAIQMKDHQKTISALSIDPSGSRLVTGSRDCSVKFWDFSAIAILKPFRTFVPYECNPVRDVAFSNSGDRVLAVTSCAHPKIYDRDGFELTEFPKGDQYVRDMKNTKGHTAALTACGWHPTNPNIYMTAGLDSTVRLWDTTWKWNNKQVIAIRSKNPGGRTAITCAAFSPDSKYIGCTGQDGTLWVYDSNGPYLKPSFALDKAHMPGSGASGIAFTRNNALVTRGMDDTVKLWDLRNFKKPVAVQQAMNMFEETNISYSPDEEYIITGVSIKRDATEGHVLLMDSKSLDVAKDVIVGSSSIVKVLWHPKINQVVCGGGDAINHVLYNPQSSTRGAVLTVGKTMKVMTVDDLDFSDRVFTLEDHESEFNITAALDYKPQDMNVRDPILTRKPEEIAKGPSKGRMGSSIMAHLIGSILKEEKDKDEDPREALLRHAKAAEENPIWVSHAYKRTQPTTILAEKVYENELEEKIDSKKQRRK